MSLHNFLLFHLRRPKLGLRASSRVRISNTLKQMKALGSRPSAFIYFLVFGTRESTRPRFHDILLEVEVKLKVIPLHKRPVYTLKEKERLG